jgi:hypothetical protein
VRNRSALAVAAVIVASFSAQALAGGIAPRTALPVLPSPTAGSRAMSDNHVARRPLGGVAAKALGAAGEIRAIALNDVGYAPRPLTSSIADFPRMAADGVTSVVAYVYLYLANPNSNDVTTGPNTPTDNELQLVGDAAKASGLSLQVMPALIDTATSTWRGRYQPTDRAAFFASYTQQILHYADFAQSAGATLFYVGSENQTLVGETAQWRKVITLVRQRFSGALSFMVTMNTTQNIKFWKQLDFVSISAYFGMGEDPAPSYNRMMSAWRQVHAPIVARLVKTLQKPLIFGESGFRNQMYAFTRPALPQPKSDLPAPAAQGDAYRAELDALMEMPSVYGVTWFAWGSATTPADRSYSPAGKPAECALAAHWSTDATIRTIASAPTCDLHLLDAAIVAAGPPRLGP